MLLAQRLVRSDRGGLRGSRPQPADARPKASFLAQVHAHVRAQQWT